MSYRVLRVTSKLYRGPQPDYADVKLLKQQNGLKGLINLRDEVEDSLYYCRELEIAYQHISVVDWKTPTAEQMAQFLEFLAVPENCPALVHCWAGVGRTGLFVTCHRIAMGMAVEDAILISNEETPGQRMNRAQQEWAREFAARRS